MKQLGRTINLRKQCAAYLAELRGWLLAYHVIRHSASFGYQLDDQKDTEMARYLNLLFVVSSFIYFFKVFSF